MTRRRWSYDARMVAVERLAALGHPDGHGFDLEQVLARPPSVLLLDRQARMRATDPSELPYIEVLRDIALGRADALSDVMADDGRIPGEDALTLDQLTRNGCCMTTATDNAPARRDDAEVSPAHQLHDAIEKVGPELSRLGVDGDRLARILWTEARNTPALLKCDPASFVAAALQTAQLGLEPGHGEVWLIPRKLGGRLTVTWQLGYKGLITLAADDGIVVKAETVYEGDHFREYKGTQPRIEHTAKVRGPDDDPKPVCWYATATLADGRVYHRVLSLAEIKHRVGPAYTKSDAWKQHHNAMCMVTAIRSLRTFLPLSPRTRRADDVAGNALQAPEGVQAVSRDMVSVLSVERDDVPDDAPEAGDGPGDDDPDAVGPLPAEVVLEIEQLRPDADLADDDAWADWLDQFDGATSLDEVDRNRIGEVRIALREKAAN